VSLGVSRAAQHEINQSSVQFIYASYIISTHLARSDASGVDNIAGASWRSRRDLFDAADQSLDCAFCRSNLWSVARYLTLSLLY
jgi:hypothetical protein